MGNGFYRSRTYNFCMLINPQIVGSNVSKTLQVFRANCSQSPVTELAEYMKTKFGLYDVSHSQIEDLYNKCISIRQRAVTTKGKALENAIACLLDREKIPYLAQACVNKKHQIIAPAKGYHRHDFIIDAAIGDSYHDKIIISCKTSLRERFLQDANISCKKLFMITMDPKANSKLDLLESQHKIAIIYISDEKQKNKVICESATESAENRAEPLDEMLDYIKTMLH